MAIPQEEQLNPSRVKRLHGIYSTLKSKGDDEGLAEFTEYMKKILIYMDADYIK